MHVVDDRGEDLVIQLVDDFDTIGSSRKSSYTILLTLNMNLKSGESTELANTFLLF